MTIYFRADQEGGFTVLDTGGVSHYQHPGTEQARQAETAPWRIAVELLDHERFTRTRYDMPSDPTAYADYDHENAQRIQEGWRDGSTLELIESVARIEKALHERGPGYAREERETREAGPEEEMKMDGPGPVLEPDWESPELSPKWNHWDEQGVALLSTNMQDRCERRALLDTVDEQTDRNIGQAQAFARVASVDEAVRQLILEQPLRTLFDTSREELVRNALAIDKGNFPRPSDRIVGYEPIHAIKAEELAVSRVLGIAR